MAENSDSIRKAASEAMKSGEVTVAPLIRTTISDDRGDEPLLLRWLELLRKTSCDLDHHNRHRPAMPRGA